MDRKVTGTNAWPLQIQQNAHGDPLRPGKPAKFGHLTAHLGMSRMGGVDAEHIDASFQEVIEGVGVEGGGTECGDDLGASHADGP